MSQRYRIGVVGLGVGGCTVSQLLARAGHAVTVFERAPQVGPVGAGILLQPSGQLVLEKMGLLDRVISQGEPIEELHALTHRGKTLIRLPYSALGPGFQAYGLHRGDLFSVLYEEVQRAGVGVQLHREIQGTQVEGNQVWLTDCHRERHGPFDFVIAADGSRSLLRGASRLHKWVHPYAYGAIWAIGRCGTVRRKLHQVVRGTKCLMGLLPMGQDRCSLFWSLHCGQKEALWKSGFARWKLDAIRLCPEAGELLEPFQGCDQLFYTTYQHVWMKACHDDHVLYIGDAAHAMSPHLGQGVNLAMIDAYLFARTLENSRDFHQAFRRHVRERRQQLRFYSVVTFLLTPFFQSTGWIKGWGRDLFLPWMTRVGWMRREMARTMAGLKPGFLGTRWSLDG